MLRRLLGKVKAKVVGASARPVTEATPDDWNRVDRRAAPAVAGELAVEFRNLGVTATVAAGTSLLDAALAAGVDLNHYCGGMCSCGSCRLVLLEGEVSPLDDWEDATLGVVREGEQDRLGCQTKVLGPVVVEVPPQDF